MKKIFMEVHFRDRRDDVFSVPSRPAASEIHPVPSRVPRDRVSSRPVPQLILMMNPVPSRVPRKNFFSHRDRSSLSTKTLLPSLIIVSSLKPTLIIHFYTQSARKSLSTIPEEKRNDLIL
jgi:hypothetical protein